MRINVKQVVEVPDGRHCENDILRCSQLEDLRHSGLQTGTAETNAVFGHWFCKLFQMRLEGDLARKCTMCCIACEEVARHSD